MIAHIALMIVCLAAAEQPPMKASADDQAAIIDHVVEGLAILKSRDRSVQRAKEAYKARQFQDWLSWQQQAEIETRLLSAQFKEAINLVQSAYSIAPPQETGTIVNGPFAGKQTQWAPRFLDGTEEYRKIILPDGREQYIGGNVSSFPAGTWADGEVFFRIDIFKAVAAEGNPSSLAYLVHHESGHFGELVTRGWDSYEGGELRAYTRSLKYAPTFELSAAQLRYIERTKAEYRARLSGGQALSPFPRPEDEPILRQGFELQQSKLKWLEEEKHRVLQMISDRKRRERESRIPLDNLGNQAFEMLEVEAHRCGFEADNRRDQYGRLSFKNASGFYYYIEPGSDLEAVRMSLFLARACLAGSARNVCNEGPEIINRRWNEEGFRDKIAWAGRYFAWTEDDCLMRLKDELQTPVDARQIDKILAVCLKQRADNLRKETRRENRETPRSSTPREPQERRSDQGHDFDKARRTIDKYRRGL